MSVSQESDELRSREMSVLRKRLSDTQNRAAQLEEMLRTRQVEQASMKLLYAEFEV